MQQTLNSALGNLRGGPKWLGWTAVSSEGITAPSKPSMTENSSRPIRHPRLLSTSTSPQLPNVVSDRPHPSPAQYALPSPAPSDNVGEGAAVPNGETLPSTNGIGRDTAREGTPARPRATNGGHLDETRYMEGSRQAVGPGSGPHPWPQGQPRSTEIAQVDGAADGMAPLVPRSGNLGQQQIQSGSLNTHPISRPTSIDLQRALQASNRPAQGRSAPSGPFTGSVQQLNAVSASIQLASSGPQNPDCFSRAYCEPILTHFLSVAQERKVQFNETDQPRINLLRQAVSLDDREYLMIHQIYCLSAQTVQDQLTASACVILRQVLGDNAMLSPIVRHFFSTFPMSMHQLATEHGIEHSHQRTVFRRFAEKSSLLERQKEVCLRRRVPVNYGELVHNLNIFSSVLQDAIFLLITRVLYPELQPGPLADPLWERQLLELLEQNRREFQPHLLEELQGNSAYPHMVEWQRWVMQFSTFAQRLSQSRLPQHQQRTYPPLQVSTPAVITPPQTPHVAMPVTPGPAQSTMSRPIPPQGRRGRPPPWPSALVHPRTPGPPPQPSQAPRPTTAVAARSQSQTLVPPVGTRLNVQREPMPARFALHEANLRSPLLRPQLPSVILHQYVTGFAKPPSRLTEAGQGIATWTLSVSEEDMLTFPEDLMSKIPGKPLSRIVDEDSKMWRLRCVKWLPEEPPSDHEWATADTSWLPYTYFTFNGTKLSPRKKIHWGKDLPIDLTSLIRQGDNVLEIAMLDENSMQYWVAIEVVSFQKTEDVKQFCLAQNRVSDLRVTEEIRRKLSCSGAGDDEIAIVQSNLTINLFDPISRSGMCATPVRSKACRHHDCFDLETYLQSRTRKGNVSVADSWRCPICKADARPQLLIFDTFVDNVRQDLEEQGLGRTEAIVVDKHGVWEPKPDAPTRSVQEQAGSSVEERQRSVASPTSANASANATKPDTREVEVIDLT